MELNKEKVPRKILITGSTGMLGLQVFEKFRRNSLFEVVTTGQNKLDRSKEHYQVNLLNKTDTLTMLESVKPDIVIHCAAITDLSYCIKYPDRAQKLHVDASAVLASFPSVEKMVYISTDSVFKGTKGYYSEEEITNPLNIYATTKRDGELAVMNESNQGYIIRTNIIGYKEPLGNSLFEWAYKEVSNGHSINGFTNVLFNPLYTGLLAGMLIEFLQSVASPGYYHFASDTPVSKYTFLQKVAEALGFHQAFISPVELDNSLYEVQRPLNTSLCTKKLAGIGISIPDIDQCIYELVKDFKMSSDNGERI